MTESWQAGSATALFPIAEGTPLGGYIDRVSGATGTLDPLEIGAIVLKVGMRQLTIVTADVVGVDRELRDAIATQCGIPADEVLLCASHTHSGPRGIVDRLHPADEAGIDEALRARFIEIAVCTVARARDRTEPVTLWHSEIAVDGVWTNRNNLDGPNDPRIRLLFARRVDGSLQSVIVLTACHPTVLGSASTMVSADLVGGIRNALRAVGGTAENTAPTILSLTGSAGDVSTRFTRVESSAHEIARLAGVATIGAGRALSDAQQISPTRESLSHHHASILLPSFREDHDASDPQRDMREAQIELTRIDQIQGSEASRRQAITRYQGAYLRSLLVEIPDDSRALELSGWRLDTDLGLLTVPAELFTSLGATIERESPFGTTWIVGYGNGYAGYIASRDAYTARTYEAMASPYASGAGDLITKAASTLLRSL